MLLVNARHDPATPIDGAERLQAALGNGSPLLVYEGDGHSRTSSDVCLGQAVTAWLLEPGAPVPERCPGIPPEGL
jgi:hypothetical protein